ncbi:DNA-directed primase/polymerase protein-like isoform X2 [Tachypleus tridentatus]|uniref:DNA-directed primase/polymerase protein-like isoform X2 n=1 Tax=Tachypleus tridentatus TaxID=6853 RepID=UPI003FD2298F
MFSPMKFYSTKRPTPDIVYRTKKQLKDFSSKPLPASFKTRIEGLPPDWMVFRKQTEAIQYVQKKSKDLMVFSFEEKNADNPGQRLYLVTHPLHLWLNHRNRPPDERCTYEVIIEGTPSKIYFDLEFEKKFNPTKHGPDLVKVFIKCVCYSLFEIYGIEADSSLFLWLDASTKEKFSCHLILQLKDIAFVNNVHVGGFVHYICEKIRHNIDTVYLTGCGSSVLSSVRSEVKTDNLTRSWPDPSELWELNIFEKDGNLHLFCDEGVYTKNRNFRLYLSTKMGKGAPLVLAPENQYLPQTPSTSKNIFLDSLVTHFRCSESIQLLTFTDTCTPKQKLTNLPKRRVSLQGCQQSPYCEVDKFVHSLVASSEKAGYIRRWTYYSDDELLVYDIAKYRFCENIGRHHKSNNIMIIVDLRHCIYYQKCLDPDCRAQGFKSTSKSLPREILPWFEIMENSNITQERDLGGTSDTWSKTENQLLPFDTEILPRVSHQGQTFNSWDDDKLLLQTYSEKESPAIHHYDASYNCSNEDDDFLLQVDLDTEMCVVHQDD